MSAGIRAAAATATRWRINRTASGSRGTATSAWWSIRCSSARSRPFITARTTSERWWWHSRGYTPAGVEAWNGVRGIDYLVSRPDVDPERIAVTGISGGGAATFWVAAADERVKVAVPVSGMADLESYVANRVINGHCDCMFLYNTFQWPWTRIAGARRAAADAVRQQRHDRSFRWTPTSGSSTGWSGSTACTARAIGSTRSSASAGTPIARTSARRRIASSTRI